MTTAIAEHFDNTAFDAMYRRILDAGMCHELALQKGMEAGKAAGYAKFKAGVLHSSGLIQRPPSGKVEKTRLFAGRKSISELSLQAAESVPDLVAGYLPSVGYNVMIGESGLGKSPLLVQLGICVAMGLPFLRMPTTRARVLMVDYENHTQLDGMVSTICKFLGADRSELRKSLEVLDEGDAAHVIAQAKDYGAGLVLVDALRGLSSLAESKNDAASDLIGQLNELKACKLLLHHPRKADRKAPPPALEADDTNLMMWLQEAAGARALINQASTRIAVDGCRHADLLLRAHYKVKGEVPRVYVSRIVDEWGEPVGYAAAEGEQLLSLNQRSWFRQVQGQTIPFAQLPSLFHCNNRLAAEFVADCQQAGIAVVTGTVKSKTDPRKVAFRGNVDVMDVTKTEPITSKKRASHPITRHGPDPHKNYLIHHNQTTAWMPSIFAFITSGRLRRLADVMAVMWM